MSCLLVVMLSSLVHAVSTANSNRAKRPLFCFMFIIVLSAFVLLNINIAGIDVFVVAPVFLG